MNNDDLVEHDAEVTGAAKGSVEAAGTGIARDRDYWNHGTHWICAERAAGRRP